MDIKQNRTIRQKKIRVRGTFRNFELTVGGECFTVWLLITRDRQAPVASAERSSVSEAAGCVCVCAPASLSHLCRRLELVEPHLDVVRLGLLRLGLHARARNRRLKVAELPLGGLERGLAPGDLVAGGAQRLEGQGGAERGRESW